MKATVFIEPGRIELEDKPVPDVGSNNALVRVTTTAQQTFENCPRVLKPGGTRSRPGVYSREPRIPLVRGNGDRPFPSEPIEDVRLQ